jgi:hypothetical protein
MSRYSQDPQDPQNRQPLPHPSFLIREKKKNGGVGATGFSFALWGLILFWVPLVGWVLCISGAIMSIIGCAREPLGQINKAVAGIVISIIGLVSAYTMGQWIWLFLKIFFIRSFN